MATRTEAKNALDAVIKKSRVHLYKPIQIAEILYRDRTSGDIDLGSLETYRTKSKKWRDEVSLPLLGRVCTSSARFQDDLFNQNAIPPEVLVVLGQENRRTGGAVEAYIYNRFIGKHSQLAKALDYCTMHGRQNFYLAEFLDLFWLEPGLKRSIDKVYEIIVHSLFSALVEVMEVKVEVFASSNGLPIMQEFEDFAEKVMCLDVEKTSHTQDAKIYRVGVTNASDRGLDMYSNWGPAIQIKHLSLDEELAKDIVSNIASDRVVIVCKEAEKGVILSLLTQIGWRSHIQSIVTESDLIEWYEKALRGKFSDQLGKRLLNTLNDEIYEEFPSVGEIPEILTSRHYETIADDFWKKDE